MLYNAYALAGDIRAALMSMGLWVATRVELVWPSAIGVDLVWTIVVNATTSEYEGMRVEAIIKIVEC